MADAPGVEDGRLELAFAGVATVKKTLKDVVKAGKASAVTTLELTGNELKTLPDISAFSNLQTLVLDKNQLRGKLRFPRMKQLETLWMNGNQLADVDSLVSELAVATPNLHYLSTMKNPGVPDYFDPTKDMEDYSRYRLFVIASLPSLTFLDDQPIEPEERRKASSVGKFQKMARPTGSAAGGDDGEPEPESLALAFDANLEDADDEHHLSRGKQDSRAYLGYSPYKHLAHDSEGNRTIGSDDL